MEVKQTASEIRAKRGTTRKNEKVSYIIQQIQHAKSQGRFKDDTEGRDKQYALDINYIQNISMEDIPKEWADKIEEVIAQHNSDVKNTARFKTKVIKIIFDFKEHQKKHDDALEKMLNLLGG